MGYVREERATYLIETALRDWLEDGYLPTPGELKDKYVELEKEFGDLSRSALRLVDKPQRFEESSASEMNAVATALIDDMVVLLRALEKISELNIINLSEWATRAKALEARIERLKLRVESLLLLKSDAAGYVSFVEDGFYSLENVSTDTTANVDTHTGEVTLKVDRSVAAGDVGGTQVNLAGSSVSFGLIESGNIRYTTDVSSSGLGNVLLDRNNRWGQQSKAKQPRSFNTASKNSKPVVGELKVTLPNVLSVSKILLNTSDATAGDVNVVAAQYSRDGYTWENVPSVSSVQSGTGNFVWRFPKTEIGHMKIIISKASPDSSSVDGTLYDFGIQQVKVWDEQFRLDTGGVYLTSEVMTPTLGGSPVTFDRASLEVCEEVPEDTTIRYSIRAYDGASYTSWAEVVPLNNTSGSSAAVVDFSALTKIKSYELTTLFDSDVDVEGLNLFRKDGASNLSYRFGGPNDTIANFYISSNSDDLADVVLLRNIGYASGKFPTVTNDYKVGDVECGWGLENGAYFCDFLIKHPSGRDFKFGESQAMIDGRTVSGTVHISSGWHSFSTNGLNWRTITGDEPLTAIELEALDPLYPYNHKYIIEGFQYAGTFQGNKVYEGVDSYGQYKATRLGRHDFLQRDDSLEYFALDTITGPKTIVLLKHDSGVSSHVNERVRLFANGRNNNYEGVQFKATLESRDADKTPVLSYYRIRVK